jgi:diacylglycerol kinase family enzyme
MSGRRFAAAFALFLGALAAVLAVVIALHQFPRGVLALLGVAIALVATWYFIVGQLPARIVAGTIGALALAGAILVMVGHSLVDELTLIATVATCLACARFAYGVHVDLPPVVPPEHPVLILNPRSGGGKAERFSLPEEARSRGIEPIEFEPGDDLERVARDAVAAGADALAMAGGDGSQAVVAAVAAEHDLPYACVPAGTRNHFALDLGVDRDDVVGALDAFTEGGERRVDLAEVNGRAFVNNVSLGLYASAVQQPGYRDAKLRTLLETVPKMVGADGSGIDLRWTGPDGHRHTSAFAILVSNNRYRLGRAVGSGTRPRIDDGLLGLTVAGAPRGRGPADRLQRPWREWSASRFAVEADEPIPTGIDGEAAVLTPPLRFRILPGVLRVRVSLRHPGASPSAAMPEGLIDAIVTLVRITAGRDPRPASRRQPTGTSP